MNPFRADVRDESAYVALTVCHAEGDRIQYQDRATSPVVDLWAVPGSERFELTASPALQEQHCFRAFTVPRQYGECNEVLFPPQYEPSAHAQIYYQDYSWAVENWTVDSVGACYILNTIRHTPRRVTTTE
jgi:hypothetical protein